MNNNQILGHKKRIVTRRLNGWIQSPNANENMKISQLNMSKEKRDKIQNASKMALRNSDWVKLSFLRNFFRRLSKLKYPKIIIKITGTCPNCKKDYLKNNKNQIYCNIKCSNESRIGTKRPNFSGENNPQWNGGKDRHYKSFKRNGKTFYTHITVCLKKLGINRLPKGCCVHHLDLDKFNNSPENLQLLEIDYHNKFHNNLMRK